MLYCCLSYCFTNNFQKWLKYFNNDTLKNKALIWWHYKNTPIQIFWKFHHQNWKFLDKNSDIFNIRLASVSGYSLEASHRDGSNVFPQFYVFG